MATPVILIFDVGKTNKKLFLFNEQYKIVFEETKKFEEIKDEDGFPCEDLQALSKWMLEKFQSICSNKDYNLRAVNFSAYGASFVHLNDANKPLTPLYNYLKPYPEKLKKQFYNTYGDESLIARQTASPVLGSLNSGMQLYRLKYEQPEIFSQLKYSLHLPQYLSYIISSQSASDITSVGCHTQLWNFQKNEYHEWVNKEELDKKLAPLYNGDKIISTENNIKSGIGLHDSSAALIPYLASFNEHFILISTGTWNISLNPFNQTPLTHEELNQDCLCYLSYKGSPVKASRLFAGYEHEQAIKKIALYFNKDEGYFRTLKCNHAIISSLKDKQKNFLFDGNEVHEFSSVEEAYHALMIDIITKQVTSAKLILENSTEKIFVDGGFGNNEIFMNLLAASFPNTKVYAASIAQASALGAALVLHDLSKDELSSNLIELKYYPGKILSD